MLEVAAMFETLFRLLDKVDQLVRIRETKRRRLLDDYARPILKEMQRIHDDYRNSISDARKLLEEGASPASVLETTNKDKWTLQPVRDRVTASVKAIIEREPQLDKTGIEFFFSLERYFCVLGSNSAYSFVIRELETDHPSERLMSLVVNWLDGQWREVADAFAKFEASLA